jgi:superfamily I DNA/RNA helicase
LFDIGEDSPLFADFFDKIQSTELIDSNRTWVQCITIHGAKWLERKHVFLLWMYKWIYPSPRSELFDELNIWYVAISRAKECLYIPYSLFNNLKATQLSKEIKNAII